MGEWQPLTDARIKASVFLAHCQDKFDAIVTAGDMHGVALGAALASDLNKPLMLICRGGHDCVQSHIVMIGDCTAYSRLLYVDDMFAGEASLHNVFEYMNQSRAANIVATYEVCTSELTWLSA